MSKCLNLTKTGEYAIAALSRLALSSGRSEPYSISVLARQQNIPPSFLSKIMAQCVKAGILHSKQGPSGGVALNLPAEEISLLSIIEACEGSYQRASCVFFSSRRCDGPNCEVYCPLRAQEEELRAGLNQVTLADMAEALNRHPNLTSGQVMEAFDGHSGQS